VVGNGNVALDAARILLRTPAELEKTDIAAHALDALRDSRVREVFILGRRGPEQASFTAAELEELGEMEDAEPIVAPSELAGLVIPEAARNKQQQRILKILQSFATRQANVKSRKLHLRFLLSPTEIFGGPDGGVSGLILEKNRLEVQADGTVTVRGTGETEVLDIGMVLPAIGFSAERIAGVPYDEKARIVANEDGRVIDPVTRSVVPNEYVVGWARTGPQGLIGSHKAASAHVVAHMITDGAGLATRVLPDRDAIINVLHRQGVQIVSFDDWKQLDDVEMARGVRRDAPRDKIVDVEAMLAILGQH